MTDDRRQVPRAAVATERRMEEFGQFGNIVLEV